MKLSSHCQLPNSAHLPSCPFSSSHTSRSLVRADPECSSSEASPKDSRFHVLYLQYILPAQQTAIISSRPDPHGSASNHSPLNSGDINDSVKPTVLLNTVKHLLSLEPVSAPQYGIKIGCFYSLSVLSLGCCMISALLQPRSIYYVVAFDNPCCN